MNIAELLLRGFAEALINFLTSITASALGYVFDQFLFPSLPLPFLNWLS